jgi:hypothetical protein
MLPPGHRGFAVATLVTVTGWIMRSSSTVSAPRDLPPALHCTENLLSLQTPPNPPTTHIVGEGVGRGMERARKREGFKERG